MNPAQSVVGVVLQVRDGRLQVLLWERALDPFAGLWSLPGGRPRPRRDAGALDPAPSRGEGRRAGARPPRAARDEERPGQKPAPLGARDRLPRARAGGRRPGPPRRHPLARRSTTCRGSPSTTSRSCSPGASASGRSSRTRTSASHWLPRRFTISELRDLYRAALAHDVSATNLQRVLLRRHLLELTGTRREPGPAGGRPAALYGFRSRTLEITDQFAVLRPPTPEANLRPGRAYELGRPTT